VIVLFYFSSFLCLFFLLMTAGGPCRDSESNCTALESTGGAELRSVPCSGKRAVDTVHGGDGAGLSDWFPLSQVQVNAARKGNGLDKQAVTH